MWNAEKLWMRYKSPPASTAGVIGLNLAHINSLCSDQMAQEPKSGCCGFAAHLDAVPITWYSSMSCKIHSVNVFKQYAYMHPEIRMHIFSDTSTRLVTTPARWGSVSLSPSYRALHERVEGSTTPSFITKLKLNSFFRKAVNRRLHMQFQVDLKKCCFRICKLKIIWNYNIYIVLRIVSSIVIKN